MNDNGIIKLKAIHGTLWNLLSNISTRLISFVIQIILARLLLPNDFGLIAIIVVIENFAYVFVINGYSTALIQKKELSDLDTSSAFFMGLSISLLLYGLIFIIAPSIALFYRQPQLLILLRIGSVTLVINSLVSVQKSLISRNLNFHLNFKISLISAIVQGVIGISLAFLKFGAWALIASSLGSVFINTILTWISVKWHPQFIFSFKSIRTLFSYNSNLLMIKLLKSLQFNISSLIIGKRFDIEMLAFFNKGNQLPDIISTSISGAINSVSLPILSKYQENINHIRDGLRRIIRISCFIGSPIKFGLMAIAETLIPLLLTPKWAPSILYMQIACISLILGPFAYKLDAYNAIGRTKLSLYIEIVHKVILIIFILISIPYGVIAIAYSSVAANLVDVVVSLISNKKVLKYPVRQQLQDFLPSNIIGFIMFVPIYLLNRIDLPLYLLLIVQIILGCIIYYLISLIFNRREIIYFYNLIRTSLTRKARI